MQDYQLVISRELINFFVLLRTYASIVLEKVIFIYKALHFNMKIILTIVNNIVMNKYYRNVFYFFSHVDYAAVSDCVDIFYYNNPAI